MYNLRKNRPDVTLKKKTRPKFKIMISIDQLLLPRIHFTKPASETGI